MNPNSDIQIVTMCTRTLRDTEKKIKIDKKILKRNSDKILASVM